jgi:hypothetical protein
MPKKKRSTIRPLGCRRACTFALHAIIHGEEIKPFGWSDHATAVPVAGIARGTKIRNTPSAIAYMFERASH